MPKRNSTKRVDTFDLQPPDGYFVMKAITVAEAKELQTQTANGASDEQKDAVGKQLFAEMILEWNWCDEEGNPLPQPHHNPDVFDLLTPAEIKRLGEALGGFPDEKKG